MAYRDHDDFVQPVGRQDWLQSLDVFCLRATGNFGCADVHGERRDDDVVRLFLCWFGPWCGRGGDQSVVCLDLSRQQKQDAEHPSCILASGNCAGRNLLLAVGQYGCRSRMGRCEVGFLVHVGSGFGLRNSVLDVLKISGG